MNAAAMYRDMKCGDEITVMEKGRPMRAVILRLPELTDNYDPGEGSFDWLASFPRFDGSIRGSSFPEDEGVEWLPGWSDDNEAILRAVNALRPEAPPTIKIDWSFNHNGGKLIR